MDTGKKKIVYFHLEEGKSLKRRFFQPDKLSGTVIEMEDGYGLLLCSVPEYYAHGKPWNREKLAELLGNELKLPQIETYYMQPQLSRMLEMREKLPPEIILRQVFRQNPCWEYLLLIGSGREEEEIFRSLIKEYLPRINHFSVITDQPADYEAFADSIYDEYGIPTAYSGLPERRLGKRKRTVIVDGRPSYRPPAAVLPEEAFYIDLWSEKEKQILLETKRKDIRYLSAVKFLDTLAENGYNTRVNQT